MSEYRQKDIIIDGVKTHYYRAGNGTPAVVFLHGATDAGMCWISVTDKLLKTSDVLMPDALGHGLSDRLTPDFKYEDHAHQTAAVIQALGIEKPVLVGHSMGAGTAANVAAMYPDLPAGVVLEDPGWFIPDGDSSPPPTNPDIMTMTVEELMAQKHIDAPTWPQKELKPWAESKKQYDQRLFAMLKIGEPFYRDIVPMIQCPALLITSDQGIVTDKVASEAVSLSKAERPMRHVKIMGAGHNIRREQFDRFYAELTGFIKNL